LTASYASFEREKAMFKMHDEDVIYITCDFCLNQTFDPILEGGDDTEQNIVWDQAEEEGWTKYTEGKAVLHACPRCSKGVEPIL
jgi:hypothetical protein